MIFPDWLGIPESVVVEGGALVVYHPPLKAKLGAQTLKAVLVDQPLKAQLKSQTLRVKVVPHGA